MTLKTYLPTLFFDVFVASLCVYTAALFFEALKKGSIVNYVNLSTVLLICIISGVLAAVFPPGSARWHRWATGFWSVCAAVLVAVIVYRFSSPFAEWRFLFATLAGCTILIPIFLAKNESL